MLNLTKPFLAFKGSPAGNPLFVVPYNVCLLLLFLVALFFSPLTHVTAQSLSDKSIVSLLTGSPGKELYSTFGHSAIRVRDPLGQLDIVFNYGTFNFNTPNFYVKFAQGKLPYMLSVEKFEHFQLGFQFENRAVVEQVLNLTSAQKNDLYSRLLENFKPENRYYKYDFFFDNCATRIRDILQESLGNQIQFCYPTQWQEQALTFRNLIDQYLGDHPWSDFGIDLALGLPTDKLAQPGDYVFLPDYLAFAFDSSLIERDGNFQSLVISTNQILDQLPTKSETAAVFTPQILAWVLCAATFVFTLLGTKRRKRLHWIDMTLFSIIGLSGWVIFLLWFFTDHIATKGNLNLLWAIPLHFPVFLLWNTIPFRTKKIYIWIVSIICIALLACWTMIPQNFHAAIIPITLAMLARYLFMIQEFWTPKPIAKNRV